MMKYMRWSQEEKQSWLGFTSLLRFQATKDVFLKNKIILLWLSFASSLCYTR